MKSGTIRKTTSYIMAVPMKDADINTPQMIYDRINASDEFELKEISFDDKNICPMLTVIYKETEYLVDVKVETLNIDPEFIFCHPVSDEYIKALKKAKVGLTTSITFSDNLLGSFHFQLKLLNCILPDMAAVVDFNTQRILSPLWIRSAAHSSVSPGPNYMFSVNVVSDENGIHWIHTYGLNRCGFIELEVLNCKKESVNFYASLLNLAAGKAITENSMPDELKPLSIARLNSQQTLAVTWRSSEDVITEYGTSIPGTGESRSKYQCIFNGILYIYPLGKKNKKPCKTSDISGIDLEDAIIEIAASETERMRIIAIETLAQLTKGLAIPGARAIVKLQLDVSENSDGMDSEHIWAEVDEIGINQIACTALQNSAYSDKIKQNDKISTNISDITDWVLNINGRRISPDCAFLVDII